MAATLLQIVTPKTQSLSHQLSSSRSLNRSNNMFLSEGTILVRRVHPSSRRKASSSTQPIKCLIGKVILPIEDDFVKGVIPTSQTDQVKREDFPSNFVFGASTSALQTEGSGTEGGRGPSTWDVFLRDSKQEGGGMAVDSYNKYKEDVKLLKDMGMNAYRMSISWSRLLPTGKLSGGINQEGIDFYNNFFKELLDNGIEPFVTLFHFDLPVPLQTEYKGFLSKNIVNDFKDFVDLCYKSFGDKVKRWTTINEPQLFGKYGYRVGLNPPGNIVTDPYVAAHNIILCHGAAARLYKDKYQPTQGGEIGISVVGQWFVPHSDLPADKEAAYRANSFMVGWFMEPLVYGDYPFLMRALVREHLPHFTPEEKEMVKGSCDFIGVNYYTSRYAKHFPHTPDYQYDNFDKYQHVKELVDKDGVPIGKLPPSGSNAIYIYPAGLRDVLIHIKNRYEDPKIYVTENGVPEARDDSIPLDKALEDDIRIEVIISHLSEVQEARKAGVHIKGYFTWALMDCMEMSDFGKTYDVRFGLNYTDYKDNFKRYPKKSAKWFTSFLKN